MAVGLYNGVPCAWDHDVRGVEKKVRRPHDSAVPCRRACQFSSIEVNASVLMAHHSAPELRSYAYAYA